MSVTSMYGDSKMERVDRAAPPRFALTGLALVLLGALLSFVLSVSLWFTGNHEQGIFVGLWVPSILALGAIVHGRGR